MMKTKLTIYSLMAVFSLMLLVTACDDDKDTDTPVDENPNEEDPNDENPVEVSYSDVLSNQIEEVIIPTMVTYQTAMGDLVSATSTFSSGINDTNLNALRSAYQQAYLAYQAAGVHDYYATANRALVRTSNLYPVDTALLRNLIASASYDFTTSAQERANGFPAMDFMLFGPDGVVDYFQEDQLRIAFFTALVASLKENADALVDSWSGNLRTNFVENGGTAIGSSISVQLNETMVYYEDHVRENKVGIPIGRLGPNDSPIDPDDTKIEAYYQSLFDGNENFTLSLLKASVEEMEDIYLGSTTLDADSAGYDDLLIGREQSSIDVDIKAQYELIYNQINGRTSISGDDNLYAIVQGLVTLYKSDLFPLLNVQDADGANDGD